MKFLFWALVLALFFFVLGFKRGRPDRDEDRAPAPPAPPPARAPTPASTEHLEEMVRCAECGMHLPATEALPGRGGVFCSAGHRAEHEARLSPPDDGAPRR